MNREKQMKNPTELRVSGFPRPPAERNEGQKREDCEPVRAWARPKAGGRPELFLL